MRLRSGKDEIVLLTTKAIGKYEKDTGRLIVRNSNRKNYEPVARVLSEISNNLPFTADELQHDSYAADSNPRKLDYPNRKYDITGNQIKDAFFNQIVSHPRSFLVDACYIYLYGKGRKGFEHDPVDPDLLVDENHPQHNDPLALEDEILTLKQQLAAQEEEMVSVLQDRSRSFKRKRSTFLGIIIALVILFVVTSGIWYASNKEWRTVRKEMNLLPYQPTQAEIDSLTGIWLCYTGSPQARSSDANRYHMVVSNVLDVKYHDGYFTFMRYGASFDHIGYMQFESPWLVSIHSYARNGNSLESPRHSLMRLNEKPPLPVISASWNFDIASRNSIIGIREVYIKQGKGGKIEEVINTIENAGCRCKILEWYNENNVVKFFYLKNELLDSLADNKLRSLIDEKSILERNPGEGLIYHHSDSLKNR
jgi:hypothetical protein